ncbi:hypothetical protein L202_07479 [Cryptococcus amylolentus CBS 6039]|uniref:Uncharacterized protein n=2 Tax=Cryptococcus amylolentus TaxID=104669 RepID=A0A1E3HCY9_9TREE|nr:hypothetical protein L202_07479 [Cryptococcus amylolentus CBS 6039]ODN73985.1 hypothetical protein L202_07479 [Cryptococcus amylolentus CBS 6039]ODO00192.1 hypothetical protein I350_06817 [Cryptococcus amylolentus CBS 6273]
MDVESYSQEEEPSFRVEETDPMEVVKSQLDTHPQHPQLFASLAEYSLQVPRTFPIVQPPDDDSTPTFAPHKNIHHQKRRTTPPVPDCRPGPSRAGPSSDFVNSAAPSMSRAGSQSMSRTISQSLSHMGSNASQSAPFARVSVDRALSERPRRPSPHLHEIQPPSRRLSSHQMLLLTPFGGQVPMGTLPGLPLNRGGAGMSRGSSSMGTAEGVSRSGSRSERPSVPPGLHPRREGRSSQGSRSSGTGVGVGAGAVNLGRDVPVAPLANLPPRVRQSLGAVGSVTHHSPLASAPMATITSQGSSGESQSQEERGTSSSAFMSRDEVDMARHRKASASTPYRHSATSGKRAIEHCEPQVMPTTVAMSRFNSLPVLTLRELEALIDKDGELGIQRGGHWAWVSREVKVDEHGNEVCVGSISKLVDTDASIRRDKLPQGPVSQRPILGAMTSPSFSDPFSSRSGVNNTQAFIPIATSADYHYSPTYNHRRMSEAPVSPTLEGNNSRRPSMPVSLAGSARANSAGYTPRQSINLASRLQPVSVGSPENQALKSRKSSLASTSSKQGTELASLGQSPGGTPVTISPPPRPRITRYKSSPARSSGLGLNLTLVQQAEATGDANSRRGSATDEMGDRRMSTVVVGHWAEVDFIDPVAATVALSPSAAPVPLGSFPRPPAPPSEASSGVSPTAAPKVLAPSRGSITSIDSERSLAIHNAHHAHLIDSFSEFSFRGRDRVESIDSALPLMPGGGGTRLSVPSQGAGDGYHPSRGASVTSTDSGHSGLGGGSEVEGEMPRRGSLGVGAFARLRRGIFRKSSEGVGKDELPHREGRHWSDRRGSWAESLGKR